MSATYLGIDVGGTKTALALIELPAGRIGARRIIPTPKPEEAGKAFLNVVIRGAAELAASGPISGIGLGLCELVSPSGEVDSGHRVRWQGLPLLERLSAIAPATVLSDVHAASLAEARLGAGRPFPDFLFVNIGTGIASSLVIDGQPRIGANGHALVMASHPSESGPVLEEMAGGAGLVQRYGSASTSRVSEIEALMLLGDTQAKSILTEAAAMLGSALALLLGTLDPHALIFGGGTAARTGPIWT